MSFNTDGDDGDEVPTLIVSDGAPQVGPIGKAPITIVTGYLGAGSMFPCIRRNYVLEL